MRQHVVKPPTGLYRARRGLILGVCKGVAQYFDCYGIGVLRSVFWVRTIAIALLIFAGIWPMLIVYIVAALFMKPEPVLPLETEEEQDFYNSYASSRSMALRRVKRIYDHLDRRVQRLESMVTTREYDWERRFNA